MPMEELYYIGQVLLSILLAGFLGWQRVQRGKSAGARTYALVAAGSTIFTILSVKAFGVDVARVAAAVVSGIGFLGAGTILHKEDRVVGLTTAAGLWIVSAIGMAVGVGLYLFSIVSTVLVFLILMLDERKIKRKK